MRRAGRVPGWWLVWLLLTATHCGDDYNEQLWLRCQLGNAFILAVAGTSR